MDIFFIKIIKHNNRFNENETGINCFPQKHIENKQLVLLIKIVPFYEYSSRKSSLCKKFLNDYKANNKYGKN